MKHHYSTINGIAANKESIVYSWYQHFGHL